jgi:hypothetical protein
VRGLRQRPGDGRVGVCGVGIVGRIHAWALIAAAVGSAGVETTGRTGAVDAYNRDLKSSRDNLRELMYFLSQGLHSKGNTCNTEVIKGFFRSCLHTTRCWRYCVSDSLLGAISISISVMSSVL